MESVKKKFTTFTYDELKRRERLGPHHPDYEAVGKEGNGRLQAIHDFYTAEMPEDHVSAVAVIHAAVEWAVCHCSYQNLEQLIKMVIDAYNHHAPESDKVNYKVSHLPTGDTVLTAGTDPTGVDTLHAMPLSLKSKMKES